MPTTAPESLSPRSDQPAIAESLLRRYRAVRAQTETLCRPLEPEDYVLQPMPDASPTKWHLAHTTWFFETFVLSAMEKEFRHAREDANFLFNSYYNAVGERIARHRRGMLSRPTVQEIARYRANVDERMEAALRSATPEAVERIAPTIILGLNHEQQHQELILTDIKNAFAANPIRPTYLARPDDPPAVVAPPRWVERVEGIVWIGHSGDGFAFDNESPRHRVFVEPFALASRLATNGEYLAFIEDRGYERAELWLSDGWAARNASGWTAPLYWERGDSSWQVFTLGGMRPVDESEPVCHLSFYEADAFARWSGARLPTEAEWETVAEDLPVAGNFVESGRFHPASIRSDNVQQPAQFFGDVWEWTASPYVAYPGFRPASGALGEYNGKFMCNQIILRGGSCATPGDHVRASYRNFFPPDARWQFSGVRLAR